MQIRTMEPNSGARTAYREIWPFVAASVALIAAVLPLPYVYYTILRLGIVAVCGYGIISGPSDRTPPASRFAVFVPIMLVFVIGSMSRDQWLPIDIGFSIFFLLLAVGYRLRDWNAVRRSQRTGIAS
jgi:hypothetical protein